MSTEQHIEAWANRLREAEQTGTPIAPLRDEIPDAETAYCVQLANVHHAVAQGRRIVGRKIGLTSLSVQQQLGVDQPDFGYLTDKMVYSQGQEIDVGQSMIQPRAEGEIAFILKKDLMGPGISAADVLAATECVMPCFEIVDSRIESWQIKIQDTIADNASCGVLLLGDTAVSPRKLDLATCGMVVEKNGKIISTGAGAAALGSPVNCVAWLANTLGRFGIGLKAGEVILSGALVPLEWVQPGDYFSVSVGGIGQASVRFN